MITLVLLGKLLEARAKAGRPRRSKAARCSCTDCTVERDGALVEVPLRRAARRAMRFVVRAGESVPVDGIVRERRVDVDESMLTGESCPGAKASGATRCTPARSIWTALLRCGATGVGS